MRELLTAEELGNRLIDYWDDFASFSDETYGAPDVVGPEGALRHMKEEADEAIEHPKDLIEYADCFMLILDATRRAGYTLDQLLSAAETKLAICGKREWLPPDENGIVRHKK